jgi:hypothetical protein
MADDTEPARAGADTYRHVKCSVLISRSVVSWLHIGNTWLMADIYSSVSVHKIICCRSVADISARHFVSLA